MGTPFRTMLAPINAPTGDGRRFAPGALTAADTPFPFEWARERDMGHDGAVIVGAVQEVRFGTVALAVESGWISAEAAKRSNLPRSLEAIWAAGEIFDDVDRDEVPRLAEDVAEAVKLISEGVLGPSVDLDSFEGVPVREGTDQEITIEDLEEADAAGEEVEIELLVTEGRVRAATLVSIPAFQETSHPLELLEPEDDEDPARQAAALTAAVIGSVDLPVAAQDRAWDGQAALGRVFDAATDADGNVDVDAVSRAFLWRDPDQDPENRGAYSLGFADVIDGTLTIVPRGVAATAGGRGVNAADIPEADKDRIRSRICSLYDRIRSVHEEWPSCPFEDDEASARASALVASVATPPRPAAAAFDAPELSGPTPITFDWEAGRVFGHVAVWGTCHGGFADVCITPPKDPRGGDYSWFHRYPVDTADGGTVWAGRLTVGGRHPGLNLTASATMSAYDGKDVAADVRVYEDAHGIAVAGPIREGLDDAAKRVLARRKVSGDWRETPDGLALVELLALSPGPRRHSEPGFPVATHSRNGRQVALTAALGPDPEVLDLKASATAEVRAALRAERERERAAAALRRELEAERSARLADERARLAEALEDEPAGVA